MNHRVLPLSGSRFRPDMESVAVTREKNLVNTYEKTQKALEEMVSSESNCRPDVVSSGSRFRPDMESVAAPRPGGREREMEVKKSIL